MEHLEYPDGVLALIDLTHNKTYAGQTIQSGRHLPVAEYGALAVVPFVLVAGEGGTPGFVDQVERLRLEVYAEGNAALDIAKAIRRDIVGENIDTAAGFLDNIKADQIPTDAPYTDVLNQANLLVSIVTRPI